METSQIVRNLRQQALTNLVIRLKRLTETTERKQQGRWDAAQM